MTASSHVLLPGFAGPRLPDWVARRLRDGLAGVCLFGENIVSPTQLRELTDAIRDAKPDAIIAIDEEGGDVTRLHYETGSPYPGNAILGRIDDTELTRAVAEEVGWELRLAGCTLAFAPVLDVNSNPDNPVIGVRSFGADPELVARHAAAWVAGLESTGVASSPKHFPGHGDTAQDSHLALPVIDKSLDELRALDLPPFRAAIEAGARTIMTSHILLPRVDASGPATFSRTVLQGLLRDELAFDGVIVSDALDMKGASGEIGIPAAAVRALAAGCDLLCIGTRNTDRELDAIEAAIANAVEDGTLGADRLADAGARVAALAAATSASRADDTHPMSASLSRSHVSFDTARTRGAFDVRPGVALGGKLHIVAIDTAANIAVGTAPWAPFADAWVGEGSTLPTVTDTRLVLVGRDNHRHRWVRELIDDARKRHPETLVVDLGWPSDGREWADIATFGASRHVGAALLELLHGVPMPEIVNLAGALHIGIDIGGTKTDAVIVGAEGALVHQLRLNTGYGPHAVVEAAVEAATRLAAEVGCSFDQIASVGVGVPGRVDTRTGIVTHAVNLGLDGLDLGRQLSTRLGASVHVENDVNAAALGAYHRLTGAGAYDHSMAYLNLGTGLAAGIVVDGRVRRGSRGTAGEIGHIPVDPNGAECTCGQRGCLEAMSSGSAVLRQWPTASETPVQDLKAAADNGDEHAASVWNGLVAGVASSVGLLVLTVDVDSVVIGGGIAAVGDPLLEEVRTELDSRAAVSPFLSSLELSKRVQLVPAGFPSAAVGAAIVGIDAAQPVEAT